MKKIIASIITTLLALFILAWAFPTITYTSFVTLFIAATVLALLQMFAKPVLKLIFLPINIVTLGLFSFVINIFILWLATFLVPGFTIGNITLFGMQLGSFLSLVAVSFIISIFQSIIGIFIKK